MPGAGPKPLHKFQGKALMLFDVEHPVRKICHRIVDDKQFEMIIMVCIVLSSLSMAFESPAALEDKSFSDALEAVDIVFTIIFLAEMLMKLVAGLFMEDPDSYLRDLVELHGWLHRRHRTRREDFERREHGVGPRATHHARASTAARHQPRARAEGCGERAAQPRSGMGNVFLVHALLGHLRHPRHAAIHGRLLAVQRRERRRQGGLCRQLGEFDRGDALGLGGEGVQPPHDDGADSSDVRRRFQSDDAARRSENGRATT